MRFVASGVAGSDGGAELTIVPLDLARAFATANSEFFSIADNASLSIGDADVMIAAWARPTNAHNGIVVGKDVDTPANSRDYVLDYTTGQVFRFYVQGGSAGLIVTSGAAAAASWHFVVAWHDAAASTLNIQINNGTPVSAATTGFPVDSTAQFRIGARAFAGFPGYFNGRISGVGIWKRLLSADERTYLYNAGDGLKYASLTTANKVNLSAYWNLDEASGNAIDSHGSNTLADNNTVTSAAGPGA